MPVIHPAKVKGYRHIPVFGGQEGFSQYEGYKQTTMKSGIILVVAALILLSACGPKPYSETAIGKKKWRYYNKTQYGLHPKEAPKF